MSFTLSQQMLDAIRRNISASLTDTFQMMFQLDIFVMQKAMTTEPGKAVCAYMELKYENTVACITIAITRAMATDIADKLAPGVAATKPEIVQDIVCEITNIVGNHLRSYLSDKMGVEFTISLPRSGPPPPQEPPHIFNLHFRIRESDSIDLDFGYAVSAAK